MKISPGIYHTALIFYCAAIFILSSIPGDNFPKLEFDFSDKLVHSVIYAILFLLFFYSLKYQTKSVKLQKFSAWYALLFTAIYGITDEVHQYFVPNRSCEFSDWLADVAGAVIGYATMKIYLMRKSNIAACLLLIGLIGCSSSQTSNPTIKIDKEEVWLNLMPTVGQEQNILGFLIELTINDGTEENKYDIRDFKIYLNNDTIKNKDFEENIKSTGGGKTIVSLFQSNDVMYLDKSKGHPSEAQFVMTIYKNNNKLKTIKTSKLNINKVY